MHRAKRYSSKLGAEVAARDSIEIARTGSCRVAKLLLKACVDCIYAIDPLRDMRTVLERLKSTGGRSFSFKNG